jgi:hypothetical protein
MFEQFTMEHKHEITGIIVALLCFHDNENWKHPILDMTYFILYQNSYLKCSLMHKQIFHRNLEFYCRTLTRQVKIESRAYFPSNLETNQPQPIASFSIIPSNHHHTNPSHWKLQLIDLLLVIVLITIVITAPIDILICTLHFLLSATTVGNLLFLFGFSYFIIKSFSFLGFIGLKQQPYMRKKTKKLFICRIDE